MRRTVYRVAAAVAMLGVVFASGCANEHTTAPDLSGDSLGGEWHEAIGVAGAYVVMTLQVNVNTITGSGSWAIEAGRNGTMTVTGDIAAGTVELDMARSDSGVAHFRGGLVRADSLVGIIWYNYPGRVGDPVGVTFVKGHLAL